MITLRIKPEFPRKSSGYATLFSVLALLAVANAIVLSNFMDVKEELQTSRLNYFIAQTQEAAEAGIDYALFRVNQDQGISTTPIGPPGDYSAGNATFSVSLEMVDNARKIIKVISTGSLNSTSYLTHTSMYFAPVDPTASPLVYAKIPGTWTDFSDGT